MSDAILEKVVCEKCGADVRESTSFCYSCGNPIFIAEAARPAPADVASETNGSARKSDDATQAALDDLAKLFTVEDADEDKIAKAAAERKKARSQRKPKTITWEPADDSSSGLLILVSLLIAAIAGGVVLIMVFWK